MNNKKKIYYFFVKFKNDSLPETLDTFSSYQYFKHFSFLLIFTQIVISIQYQNKSLDL